MDRRRIRIGIAVVAAFALLALVSPHNRADIRILTHDKTDLSPHRVQAVIDLGIVAVSVLYTWTTKVTR
jgi:hypothetical protein